MYYYADSSVLVKRYVNEAGSNWVRSLADGNSGHLIIIVRISMIEVHSAFNRRRREARLNLIDYQQIAGDFIHHCLTEHEVVELTTAVAGRANQLLEHYPLRAYDAVQLASALLANQSIVSTGLPSLIFLAADLNLLAAASNEGLTTDNPNIYT